MTSSPTPLKFLGAGWFACVMGLCGLSLAWSRAVPLMGEAAAAAAMALGLLAGAVFLLLAAFYLLRLRRYPKAVAEDFNHPVRHPFVATLPIALILLSTVAVATSGPGPVAGALWMIGSTAQFALTVWLLSRWLKAKDALAWPGVTPVLILPAVGNVLVPLSGLPLGYEAWSAAQFGVGLFFWPVVLLLLLVRLAVTGVWPQRLLMTSFITVAPPAAAGLVCLQWGGPVLLAWSAWGVALFFLLWSASVLKRALDQPFAMTSWALSFPLAAFCALTLRLGGSAPAWFASLGLVVLALTTLVVAGLVLATVKGLREGSLLAPETVAVLSAAQA